MRMLRNRRRRLYAVATLTLLTCIVVMLAALAGIAAAVDTPGPPNNNGNDAPGNPGHKIWICHHNEGSKGYVQIPVDANSTDFNGHKGHPLDIIPAPEGGCPVEEGEQQTDVCTNLGGVQTSVPEGYGADGTFCYEIERIDACPNLDEYQAVVPQGYEKVDGVCQKITQQQDTDVCSNIAGIQATIPSGKHAGAIAGTCDDDVATQLGAEGSNQGHSPVVGGVAVADPDAVGDGKTAVAAEEAPPAAAPAGVQAGGAAGHRGELPFTGLGIGGIAGLGALYVLLGIALAIVPGRIKRRRVATSLVSE